MGKVKNKAAKKKAAVRCANAKKKSSCQSAIRSAVKKAGAYPRTKKQNRAAQKAHQARRIAILYGGPAG